MAIIAGLFHVDGRPIDGATVSLWPLATFSSPAKNDPLPAASGAIASTVTGAQHGGNGAYRFQGVPPSEYWCAFSYLGLTAFDYINGLGGAGTSGLVTFTATLTGALTEGQGLVYSTSGSGFVNQVPHYSCLLGIMTAYTPSATGADTGELPAPYHPDDGTTTLAFNSRRITWRCAASGSTSGTITLQKSLAANTGAFDPVTIGTLTLLPGRYEAFTATGLVGISSGDKVRVFVNTLPAATSWTITLLVGST